MTTSPSLAGLTAACLAATLAAQQSPPFHAEARLVVLHVTVTNGHGERVTNLDRASFAVFEDGRRQPIAFFRSDDVPTSLGLIVDNSGSMFVQVERSSRHSQGGLGIGLTLVRSLVELHGGRVEARSAGRGAGSEFVVELPVLRLNEAEGAKPPPDPALPGRCILVVDDNVDAADTLALLLETLGATVRVAYSGREALDSLATFDADTVLLDIGMSARFCSNRSPRMPQGMPYRRPY